MTTSEIALRAIVERGAQQKYVELVELLDWLAPREIGSVLEIGSWTGGTLWVWAQLAGLVISIDVEMRQDGGDPPGVERIIGDSHDREVKAQLLGRKFDLVHIDGDHTDEGVRRDFEMYAPLVAPGGVVVIHDIVWHPPISGIYVEDFWLELKQRYETFQIVDSNPCPLSGQVIDDAGIGVLLP